MEDKNKLQEEIMKADNKTVEKMWKSIDEDHTLRAFLEKMTKDELVKMTKEYGVYSGLSSDMTGSVKFIMRSDSVSSSKNKKATEDVTIEKDNTSKNSDKSNKSLLEKIKDIFK